MAATQWETVPLEELLERHLEFEDVKDDVSYEQVTLRIRGRGIAARGTLLGAKIKTRRQYRITAGQLLVSKIDARNGAFALVPDELDGAVVTQDFPTFDVNQMRCSAEFMHLLVTRAEFWEECLLASEGSTNRVRLSIDEFLRLEVDLPSPEEQRRIVDAVLAMDDVRLALSEEERALETLLRAGHRAAFDSLLDEPQRLADITKVVAGGTPSRDHPEYFSGDVFWVKSGDIIFRDIYETPETITTDAVDNSAAKLLPPKTVVVAMYGQGATRGRCAVLQAPMTTNQACAGILPSPQFDERFLFHWLWSQYEALREDSEGTSQPNLSKGVIENLEVPLPSPGQQKEIAARLDAILLRLIDVQKERAHAEELRPALVEALLTGARQVPDSSVALRS